MWVFLVFCLFFIVSYIYLFHHFLTSRRKIKIADAYKLELNNLVEQSKPLWRFSELVDEEERVRNKIIASESLSERIINEANATAKQIIESAEDILIAARKESNDLLSLSSSVPDSYADASLDLESEVSKEGLSGSYRSPDKLRVDSDGPIFFAYIDAKDFIDVYHIEKPKYSEKHISGYCNSVSGFRSFRRDRVIKVFDSWHYANEYRALLPYKDGVTKNNNPESKSTITKKGSLEVCFTGFGADDKKSLQKVAMENGMVVRSRVTANLSILCCGYAAGPKKMEEAETKGVLIMDKFQFINFLTTGEVPDARSDTLKP